jgi:signal transduction histidine kinase/CheY-like chemotaxis protein/predicted RNA-binding protein with RPS1 domain
MSDPNLLLEHYPLQTIISGTVEQVTRHGVLVRISPTTTGYIPNREVSWDEMHDPSSSIYVGQRISAVVTGADLVARHLLLSYRRVFRDPWQSADVDYLPQSIHSGTVDEQTEYGVFIRLEPGLVGLAHNSELPRLPGKDEPISLWPGDQVLVEVLKVDLKARRISLSMRSVIDSRTQHRLQAQLAPGRLETSVAEQLQAKSGPSAEIAEMMLLGARSETSIRHILIVDDSADFAKSLSASIRSLGYDVTYVTNAIEAKSLMGDPRFQLCLLDCNMIGMSGLELAQLARERSSAVHLVLLSSQAGPDICNFGTYVPGLVCWRKPLRIQDFDKLLAAVKRGACALCERSSEQEPSPDDLRLFLPNSAPTLARLEDLCRKELSRVMTTTHAEAGVVCGIEEGSRKVRILAQEDSKQLLNRSDLQQLKYSPVSDVIEGEMVRHAHDVNERPTRYRHLISWGSFRTFLGIPVRGDGDNIRLGIFLFHREPHSFSSYHREQALLSAGHLGLTRERQDLLRTTLSVQQAILTGRLHVALAHEVQKNIATLQSQMETLYRRIEILRKEGNIKQEVELPTIAVQLQLTVDKIGTVLERQLNFSRANDIRPFDLNRMVRSTRSFLGPMSQQVKPAIRLGGDEDPNMPRIENAENLVHQIILNLTLNAMQQMIENGLAGGELLVNTQYVPEAELPVQVLVTDSGPGIHVDHQKRLFERGFTTRSDGTGLGLYISRSAAEAMGGRLTLKESFVGYGSTFLLELPLLYGRSHHE